MFIKSQNEDVIFSLTDKGFLKGNVYAEDIYVNGKFYGTNIYGRKLFKKYLLGTYEEDEGEMVINEIFTMLKARTKYYTMPAPTMDLEDLGVIF